MFNWLKKAVVVKVIPESDVAPTQDGDSITQPVISESEALKNQGNAHLSGGQLEDAAECYRRAIALNPHYAEAYSNLGYVFEAQGNLNEAVALYRKAIEFNPNLIPAHQNLGFSLLNLGQSDAAEESLRRVIALAPGHATALQSLGVIAAQRGDFLQAETLLRRALELQPDYADAHNNLGNLFMETKRLPEAEVSYRRALELQPDNASAHYNLGNLLMETNRSDKAEASYRRALELNPDYADAHNNLGTFLLQAKRLSEAEASYRRALELKPDYADAHNSLGTFLFKNNRLQEAEASYRRALELKPDSAEAHTHLGMVLLSLGRYIEAWPHFEHRYNPNMRTPFCVIPKLLFPQWQGESLVGKSLMIWQEQGFGDYILFVRYARLLRDRGVSRLTLICTPPLKALLETVAGVDAVITELASTDLHDYWSFPLSLPLYFGTTVDTIPATFPYLYALPTRLDRWRDRLPTGRLKVGLVWKGNADQGNDVNRSLPGLTTLAPLWSVPGVTFVSLQKGQGEEEAKKPPEDQPIIHLGSDIVDFADTAAIITQLDLVICVCTSAAHLAGALGKPCWVLITSVDPSWIWLQEREDSPWYASMRLFRQQDPGDWGRPVERIRQALFTITHADS